MRQLSLFSDPATIAPEQLRSLLERGLGARVDLVLTANRTSVLTYRRGRDGSYEVRLQRLFLEAPDEVIEAIVAFVRRPTRQLRERVAAFFTTHPEAARRPPRVPAPPPEPRPRGLVHDLDAIMAALNDRYFGGAVRSRITWGAQRERCLSGAPARGRAIRFGSYLGERDLVRIHPALDASWVPRYFVEAIVHHEMLHAVIPIARDDRGRRLIHPPEFKRREQEFHAFREAVAWERENLRRLIEVRG